jgi:O-antigen/teichoic acid export membrane protein
VWSLVISSVLSRAINIALSWWYIKWLPHWGISKQAIRELVDFGGNFTLYNIIDFIGKSLDKLLIGKFMGAHDVGIYNRAYAVMLAPFTQIVWVGTSVLLPALSTIQEDKARVGNIIIRATSLITFIALPALFGLMVVADSFVRVLFGPQWLAAIPILQIFCLLGLSEILRNIIGTVIESQGTTSRLVRLGIIQSVMNIGGITAGIFLGSLEMVAFGVVLANYLVLFFYVRVLREIVGLAYTLLIKTVGGSLVCAIAMGLLVFLIKNSVLTQFSDLLQLMFSILIGLVIYSALAITIKPRGWFEFKSLATSGVSMWKVAQ